MSGILAVSVAGTAVGAAIFDRRPIFCWSAAPYFGFRCFLEAPTGLASILKELHAPLVMVGVVELRNAHYSAKPLQIAL